MSNNLQNNKFNFFVEAEIKKGKDEKGEDLIYIDGIASTSSVEDSDEETLYPSGFNLLPFLESGLVNYNHQGSKDSNANIGVPIEAKVINNGKDLYVKCMLWPCPQTTGVITAYEAFQKYNIDRKIGFSIEGRSTYKDPFNKKRILKADITGLAVTFCPKNKNTLMNIIKGEYETAFIDIEKGDLDINDLVNEYKEWTSAKEGDEFYGKEGSVKEFFENNHEDHSYMIDELTSALNGKTEKSIDTAAIAPVTPESVEHNPKDISNKKSSNFGGLLKKSDIYIQIAKSYSHNSIAEQKSIYDLVVQVNSKLFKMENMVSPEALTKAFSLLDEATALVKGEKTETLQNSSTEGTTTIQKSEGGDAVDFDNEDVKKAVETAKILVKAGMEKEAGCETLVKGGFEVGVAQASWEKALSEVQAQQNGGDITSQAAPIFKAEEVTALVSEEVRKSVDPINGTLNRVNEAVTKGFESFGTILKSLQQQNEALSIQNTQLAERLNKVESTPVGRKSATLPQAIDRFAKSNDAGFKTDDNTFNVTDKQDLDRLAERLLTEHGTAIEKGKKDDASLLEGAINQIEVANRVPEFAYRKLSQLGIKLVMPSA